MPKAGLKQIWQTKPVFHKEWSVKYERGDAILSIEVAKRITDALEVSLDFLIGE